MRPLCRPHTSNPCLKSGEAMKGQLLKSWKSNQSVHSVTKTKSEDGVKNLRSVLERHYWLIQPVTNTDMPELSHTPQQGDAAHLVLQSSFPFCIEVPANTPVCTASPHWSASKQPLWAETSILKHYCNTKLLGCFYQLCMLF